MRTRVDLHNDKIILFETPGGGATNCLISAHGWFKANAPQYTLIAPLHFYCAHGTTLDDLTSVKAFQAGNRVGPVMAAGQNVTDYTLGKLQDSHKDIATFQKTMNKQFPGTTMDEAALEMWTMGGGESYQGLEQRFNKVGYDVVTVRNRSWFKGGSTIKLSDVIASVHAHHAYANYHAVFCREAK
jgi:hypothetical protein